MTPSVCPSCSTKLATTPAMVGTNVRCSKCGTIFIVSDPALVEPPQQAPAKPYPPPPPLLKKGAPEPEPELLPLPDDDSPTDREAFEFDGRPEPSPQPTRRRGRDRAESSERFSDIDDRQRRAGSGNVWFQLTARAYLLLGIVWLLTTCTTLGPATFQFNPLSNPVLFAILGIRLVLSGGMMVVGKYLHTAADYGNDGLRSGRLVCIICGVLTLPLAALFLLGSVPQILDMMRGAGYAEASSFYAAAAIGAATLFVALFSIFAGTMIRPGPDDEADLPRRRSRR